MRRGGAGTRLALSRLLLMTLVLLLVSCGGSDNTDLGEPATTSSIPPVATTAFIESGTKVSGLGIAVDVPAGWSAATSLEGGLQIAKSSVDIGRAGAPDGPRITITPGNTVLPDPESLFDALGETSDPAIEVIEEPRIVTVGSREGAAVALAEPDGGTTIVRRYVVVPGGTGALHFLLEAPQDQWAAAVAGFDAILAKVAFDEQPAGDPVPPAPTTSVITTVAVGDGSADDPFQLPYHETFGPPVDPHWDHLIDQYGIWKWEVVDHQLVATGQDIQVDMVPRAAWIPEFEFPDLPAITVSIEVSQTTDEAACGLILGVDDGADGLVVAVYVDAINQRLLTWAPVNLADVQDGLPWIADDNIHRDAPNVIKVLLNVPLPGGEQLLLYVNDESVGRVEGWSSEFGAITSIGPSALFEASTDLIQCRFDSFSVTR